MIKKKEAFSLRAKLWIDFFSETLRIFTLRNTIHTHYNFTCQPFQRNILMYQLRKQFFGIQVIVCTLEKFGTPKYQNPNAMSRRCGAIRCGERVVRYLATARRVVNICRQNSMTSIKKKKLHIAIQRDCVVRFICVAFPNIAKRFRPRSTL